MKAARKPSAVPAKPARAELSPAEALQRILDALYPEQHERIVPYCRVADLIEPRGPFTKSWVFQELGAGNLRGVNVGKLLLIEIASVQEMLANSQPWTPKPRTKTAANNDIDNDA